MNYKLLLFLFLALGVGGASAQTTSKNDVLKRIEEARAASKRGENVLAISIYDAAINANPNGAIVPVIIAEKALAQTRLAVKAYNATGAKPGAALDEARKMFIKAAEMSVAAARSVNGDRYDDEIRLPVYFANKDVMYLVVMYADTGRDDAAVAAFNEYFLIEPDVKRAALGRKQLGELLQRVSRYKEATEEFHKALLGLPDDVDALGGFSVSMVQHAIAENDLALMQKAANELKRFLAAASPTHRLRPDAEATLAFLKEDFQIVPK